MTPEEYEDGVREWIDKLSTNISFAALSSENPELQWDYMELIAELLAGLANLYASTGYNNRSGSYIIDDLAMRSLAYYKSLGRKIDL